jgi:hypothetical protein
MRLSMRVDAVHAIPESLLDSQVLDHPHVPLAGSALGAARDGGRRRRGRGGRHFARGAGPTFRAWGGVGLGTDDRENMIEIYFEQIDGTSK